MYNISFPPRQLTTTMVWSTARGLTAMSILLLAPALEALAFSSSAQPDRAVKLLVLPGFGNDMADYLLENSIVDTLEEKGWSRDDQIRVLPVQRADWLQVFWRGALDAAFWRSDAPPTNPAFRWYLDLIAEEVGKLGEDEKMVLLGHSAGGWLARAALGFGSDESGDFRLDFRDKVLGVVTLGAPHLPPPEGLMDMTQGALRLTHENYPGAYHADELFYITVLGLAIKGVEQERKSPFEPTTAAGFAYNSYKTVCGQGDVIGDGVVPQCAGHLDGAKQIDLKNVLHSINNLDSWYGATNVIDSWHDPMVEQIQARTKSPAKSGFNFMEMFQGNSKQ